MGVLAIVCLVWLFFGRGSASADRSLVPSVVAIALSLLLGSIMLVVLG